MTHDTRVGGGGLTRGVLSLQPISHQTFWSKFQDHDKYMICSWGSCCLPCGVMMVAVAAAVAGVWGSGGPGPGGHQQPRPLTWGYCLCHLISYPHDISLAPLISSSRAILLTRYLPTSCGSPHSSPSIPTLILSFHPHPSSDILTNPHR